MELTESYQMANSNETSGRVTSGELDSNTNPSEPQQFLQAAKKPSVDKSKKDLLLHCDLNSNPASMNVVKSTCDMKGKEVYTNDCFSDSNFYPADNCSPKMSPTSLAEVVLADIRSPHLSDPEITESTRMFDENLYSFPSSPAVYIFPDTDSSCSSDESSLKLSFAYSNPNRSYNSSTGGPFSMFERDQDFDKNLNNFDCLRPNTECRSSLTIERKNIHENTSNERPHDDRNASKPCALALTDHQKVNMDAVGDSQASAAKVAQIWQEKLMMQENSKKHKENCVSKPHIPSDNSRNSGNDTSGSRTSGTSKNSLWHGKKRVLNSYFHRSQAANRNGTQTATTEQGHTANRARKALKTITFILGAFALCWVPYHTVILIKGFCDDPETSYTCVNPHLYSVTYWMCYLNSPINPFCYALANAQFKRAFLRILRMDLNRR